jgi:antitoxin (DNA-binding transcriptional repressor) of toxin-antitoxin stability system
MESPMVTIGAYQAKTRLPELLRMVEDGERIIITRHGRPVALLTAPTGLPERTNVEAVDALAAFGRGRRLGPSLSVLDLIAEGRK